MVKLWIIIGFWAILMAGFGWRLWTEVKEAWKYGE